MIRTAFALALALVAVPACKKKEDGGGGGAKTTESATTASGGEAAGKPIEMDAQALWDDYNKPGQDGLALMKKWENGVVVTGSVVQVMAGETKTTLWLGAGDDKKKVSLDFKDEGKAAKDKAIKKDDKVTAKCSIGGSDGTALMMLLDCELK